MGKAYFEKNYDSLYKNDEKHYADDGIEKKAEKTDIRHSPEIKELTELKDSLKSALNEVAEPISEIPFTRESYNKLFPFSRIKTPIENLKLGEHQFEKLDEKERRHILQSVHDVLCSPDIVINEERKSVFGDLKAAHIYAKSFKINEKNKAVQSVVVSIEDEKVSIFTHERDINNVVNKIKMPEQLIYVSAEIGQMIERTTGKQLVTVNPTRESGSTEPPLDTIPQPQEKSTENNNVASSVVVDGKTVELKSGLEEGFRNAYRKLDKVLAANESLVKENEKLRRELSHVQGRK